jgi:HPt (histidine-containing phosphotransfer) domain-containing protein
MVDDCEADEAKEALLERIEKLGNCRDKRHIAQELHSLKGIAAAYGFQQAACYLHALESATPILHRDLQRALDTLANILEEERALPGYLSTPGSTSNAKSCCS